MNKYKLIKESLLKEFKKIGYGLKYISTMSKEAQDYIIDRHKKGIKELKKLKEYPSKTGDCGYTSLLGCWYYTKSGGFRSAIGLKTVWMATLLNNDLI